MLVASGLIAGEALAGLVKAGLRFPGQRLPSVFEEPSYLVGVGVMALIALALIRIPLANAGDPNEPAPPVGDHVGMRPRDTSPEAWNVLMDLMRKIPRRREAAARHSS